MVTLGEALSLATPGGAIHGESLTFMGLQIARKCISGNCAP